MILNNKNKDLKEIYKKSMPFKKIGKVREIYFCKIMSPLDNNLLTI